MKLSFDQWMYRIMAVLFLCLISGMFLALFVLVVDKFLTGRF